MYQFAQNKSANIHKRYNLCSFPIPLWQIEQIIIDQGLDIVISKKITTSCILKGTLFIPRVNDSYARVLLSHELGHIMCHHYDIATVAKSLKNKYESQANAFAVDFLIPKRIFKIDSKFYNNFDLSEMYGVPVDFINSCVSKYLLD